MIHHSSLYHELYKFTNEYKNNEAKQLVNKFLFMQPSVHNTDGCNFINSENLYSSELDIIPNTKIYSNNTSGSNRKFPIKEIRVCNIPFSEFGNIKTILRKLNDFVVNTITSTKTGDKVTGKEIINYDSTLESLSKRKSNWNNNFPLLNTFNKKSISKWLYDLQFTSKEFYKATGLYIAIFRRKLINNTYYSSCINGNYELADGLNIRISIKSNSELEINFTDKEYYNTDGLYEICIYNKPSDTFLNMDPTLFDFNHTNVLSLINPTNVFKSEGNLLLDEKFTFKYNLPIYKSLVNVEINENIYLYDHEFEITGSNGNVEISISNDVLDILRNYSSSYSITVSFKEYDTQNVLLEKRDYLSKYNIHDIPYYQSLKIDKNNTISQEEINKDEENLRNSLPFVLEDILNRKSTFNISKIDKVLYSNIEFKNGIPCIKYKLNSKHDTVMFFKGNKLLSPTYIEYEGQNYIIYISIKDIISSDISDKIRKMKYGIIPSNEFINLTATDFWMVYDTDRHFIENMRYDLKPIYKYINITREFRYSPHPDNGEIYITDPYGEYIKYKDRFLELGSVDYWLDKDGIYKKDIPENYTGDIFRKTKTNEYLLPVNKNIDPSKILIAIEDHNHIKNKYVQDSEGSYILLTEDRYYQTYNTNDKSTLYVKINGDYIQYNESEHESYLGSFYIRKEKGYVIPPYYLTEDVRYRKVCKRCIILSNIFNMKYDEEIVSINSFYKDSYYEVVDKDNSDSVLYVKINNSYEKYNKNIHTSYDGNFYAKKEDLVETKTYDRQSLIDEMLYKKYGLRYNDVYYIDDNGNYILYTLDTANSATPTLYYKNEKNKYYLVEEVDSYISEISQFIDMNRVYKFTLNNMELLNIDTDNMENDSTKVYYVLDGGSTESFINNGSDDLIEYVFYDGRKYYEDIMDDNYEFIDGGTIHTTNIYSYGEALDGGYANTDEYISIIDGGDETDLNGEYTDDCPVYDFNFTSPYSIDDEKVKAYRIDSSYSNYFSSDDEFLTFVIPNQLINSENKLMTFLDGKFTDEFAINKHLYSRLFGGNTLLSITDDPVDYTGKDFSYKVNVNGKYYFDIKSNSYIYDENRDMTIMDRKSTVAYYKSKVEYDGEIRYIDSESYDANDIVDDIIHELDEGPCYKLKNGKFVKVNDYKANIIEIESYQKYYQLTKEYNGSYYITVEDFLLYTTSYSKDISRVFMCNMKNLSLYQNHRGVSYGNKIFTVDNSMDTIIHNERKLYKDIYFPPLSLKYMIFFINGKFANPYIKIITPQRFIISDSSFLNENEIINDVQIYAYDNYLYNLKFYNDFFETNDEINRLHGYNIYTYNDSMWNKHKELIIKYIKSDESIKEQTYIPMDTGYNVETSLVSLYEIFGKYILNKYDIDNDYTLHDEIREYFAPLFDENNRMKLELIQKQARRKYIY